MVALSDAHIVAAAQPVALRRRSSAASSTSPTGRRASPAGSARPALHGLELRAAARAGRARARRARLPAGARPVPRARAHARRAVRRAGRDARVDALFGDERYLALWPYEGLWNEAQRLGAGARTPYGAAVAIETWLRETGGFDYDQSPPRTGGLPPLAHFVDEGKRGYCQHFAGAMALMLRFLGIPARVAAGFTSGKREDGGWTVTDHNAHAWVEVWFPGYGWLAVRSDAGPRRPRRELQRLLVRVQRRRRRGRVRPATRRRQHGGAGELDRFLLKERLAERQRAGRGGGDDGGMRRLWLLLASCSWPAARSARRKLVRRRAPLPDPRPAAARRGRTARARRVPRRPAAGRQRQRHPGRSCSELVRARARRRRAAGSPTRWRRRASARREASAAAATRRRRELRSLLRVIRSALGRPARLRGLVALRSLRA